MENLKCAAIRPLPSWANDLIYARSDNKKKKEQENEINGMMKPYGRLRSHREDMCKWTLKYRCLRGTGVNYFCLSVRARYNNALTRLGTAS